MAHLGHIYANGQGVPQDNATAVRWFKKAADHGACACMGGPVQWRLAPCNGEAGGAPPGMPICGQHSTKASWQQTAGIGRSAFMANPLLHTLLAPCCRAPQRHAGTRLHAHDGCVYM